MRTLRSKLTFANVISVIALFIALGGVGYAAFKLPKNSVGTKQIRNGAVNPAKLSASAKATLTGPKGDQGPPGPGATSFATTLDQGTNTFSTVATAPNGLSLSGECMAGPTVVVRIATPSGNNLQASGISASNLSLTPDDATNITGAIQTSGTNTADLEVIARDKTIGPFARIDLHGHVGSPASSPCTFWGMITPSA